MGPHYTEIPRGSGRPPVYNRPVTDAVSLRPATLDDAPAIGRIDNQGIQNRTPLDKLLP